ncbi:MAG TPA: phosphoribosyltransferase family protein [Candidatus Saccharimonadales bacterium]|nr:phosphoribosyltransferase family protein [Candidatus Saccharimonadales bacterium]
MDQLGLDNGQFADRRDAGKKLGKALARFKGPDTVVLALPRGGVVIGVEVAKELQAPLGLVLVRKIGHPTFSEYAIGAVAEGQEPIYNQSEIGSLDKAWLKQAETAAKSLIAKRRSLYFGGKVPEPDIRGKIVVIVDDGVATGLTMEAAIKSVVRAGPNNVVIAVPVAAAESVSMLKQLANEVIILDNPNNFLGAVGSHYLDFPQVDDSEVQSLLMEAYGYIHPEAKL